MSDVPEVVPEWRRFFLEPTMDAILMESPGTTMIDSIWGNVNTLGKELVDE